MGRSDSPNVPNAVQIFLQTACIVSSALKVDSLQGLRRSHGVGHISEKLVLHCLFCYMAGGSFHNVHTNAGIAKSTFLIVFIGVLT